LRDRQALQGILFVLHTGISWPHLPLELGFGSGVTCWRRMDEWQKAGVCPAWFASSAGEGVRSDLAYVRAHAREQSDPRGD
jgi:transposase